eukprot:6181727-Pleurochrysis_carterae.AAC.1
MSANREKKSADMFKAPRMAAPFGRNGRHELCGIYIERFKAAASFSHPFLASQSSISMIILKLHPSDRGYKPNSLTVSNVRSTLSYAT